MVSDSYADETQNQVKQRHNEYSQGNQGWRAYVRPDFPVP